MSKEASGSLIEFDDGANAPFIDFSVDGKSYQETREGYNLLDLPKEYTLTGVQVELPINLPKGEYYIKWNKIISNGTDYDKLLYFYYEDGTTYRRNINNGSTSLILNAAKNIVKYNIYSQSSWDSSQNVTTTFYDLMIVKSKDKDKPYEPYGASPSPDFPSEIESVGTCNLFDINNPLFAYGDEYDKKNYPSKVENGYVVFGGLSGSSAGGRIAIPVTLGTYTFSCDITGKVASRIGVKWADDIVNQIVVNQSGAADYDNKFGDFSFTVTNTNPNKKYLIIYMFNDTQYSIKLNKVQVTKTNERLPYLSNDKCLLEVTNVGKNLFDKNNIIKDRELNGSNGTISGSVGFFVSSYIKVQPNKSYYLSGKSNGFSNCLYDKNKKFIITIPNIAYGVITIPNNLNIVYLRFNGPISNLDKIQLNEGTQPLPYEPYQGYNTQLLLPTQLKSIDNIQDKLVKRDGTWGILNNIGVTKFNGNENWDVYKTSSSVISFRLYNQIPSSNTSYTTNQYCNYYKRIYSAWAEQEYGIFAFNNFKTVYFRPPNANITTLDQWKQWLKDKYNSGNPVIVQYELETPTFIPLDQENQDKLNALGTIKGTNNITTTDTLEPNMNLTYVTDNPISEYVENRLEKTNIISKIIVSGTWTPQIVNWNNIPLEVTYKTQKGYYKILGNLVYIEIDLAFKITKLNDTNNYARIIGLPFNLKQESGILLTQVYDAVDASNNLKIMATENWFGLYGNNGQHVINWIVSNTTRYPARVCACGWVQLK